MPGAAVGESHPTEIDVRIAPRNRHADQAPGIAEAGEGAGARLARGAARFVPRPDRLGQQLSNDAAPVGLITPTAGARPAKVSALADFLIAELTDARWNADVVMGWKPPPQRRKQT
jgi:hypothetical protein